VHSKEFVKVNLTVSEDGEVCPNSIVFQKDKIFVIDALKHVCRATATKVGGSGIRYTVVIKGKETFLFESDGRWFVEAVVAG